MTQATISTRLERVGEVSSVLMGLLGRHARAKASFGLAEDHLADQLAADLEGLGVTFVKLAQTLATRRDLLPTAYIEALGRLHDDVRPMDWPTVSRCLSQAYGQDPAAVFETIDPEPLGSASVGQVHRATLWDGREVAVKVQRPGARLQVEQDLELLGGLTRRLDDLGAFGDRVQFEELVATFAVAMRLELDYRVEARNLRRIRQVLAPHRRLRAPRPVAEHTTRTVLVMSYVEGTPLSAVQGPIEGGSELARQICAAYLDQILEEGFFHADPHPGNLILRPDGTLHLIDLGLVEALGDGERALVAELVLAIHEGAPDMAREVLRQLCTPLDDLDVEGLGRDVQHAIRRSTSLRGIEPTLGNTMFDLLEACDGRGLRPPAGLASLARTLSMLDGVIARLDPEFDPGSVLEGRTAKLARAQVLGDLTSARGLMLSHLALNAPQRLGQLLDQLATGRFRVQVDAIDEAAALTSLRKIANRIAGAVIVAALLLSGAMIAEAPGPDLLGLSLQGLALLLLGFLGAAALLLSILWFDR